jgi:hypothetical protein
MPARLCLLALLAAACAPDAGRAYPVPSSFFADPGSIVDSLDGIAWLNRMARALAARIWPRPGPAFACREARTRWTIALTRTRTHAQTFAFA